MGTSGRRRPSQPRLLCFPEDWYLSRCLIEPFHHHCSKSSQPTFCHSTSLQASSLHMKSSFRAPAILAPATAYAKRPTVHVSFNMICDYTIRGLVRKVPRFHCCGIGLLILILRRQPCTSRSCPVYLEAHSPGRSTGPLKTST